MTVQYSSRYDAIVVGVGGMGSATVYQLARSAASACWAWSASTSRTPWAPRTATRASSGWPTTSTPPTCCCCGGPTSCGARSRRKAGEQLLHITGSLDAGPSESWVFKGSLQSCLEHDLPHEVLTGTEIGRALPRLPAAARDSWRVLQPEGGFLLPERCIVAYVRRRRRWAPRSTAASACSEWAAAAASGVRVRTDRGVYEADRLVITAGAWNAELAARSSTAWPCRSARCWPGFSRRGPNSSAPSASRSSTCWCRRAATTASRSSVCPASSSAGTTTWKRPSIPTGSTASRTATTSRCCASFAERYFPDGAGPTMTLQTCMFTNTPDQHFIIDLHPRLPAGVVRIALLGPRLQVRQRDRRDHGRPGRARETRHDIGLFRLDRLRQRTGDRSGQPISGGQPAEQTDGRPRSFNRMGDIKTFW